ncbi:hypothetical protein KCP70_23725 [Salmonella enterica subsp. enterica]|nr:hypothetical protein KCP70_23725 [Salmonella enterica subsp. enterica]
MKKRRAETAPSAVPAGETGKSDEQSKSCWKFDGACATTIRTPQRNSISRVAV